MIRLDLKKVADFARRAETGELLNRVTVFRNQMEPEALDLFEAELDRRGLSEDDILGHAREEIERAIWHRDGYALKCLYCDRPAVVTGWGWHRLWGVLPVFPRPMARCDVHLRRTKSRADLEWESGEFTSPAS